VRTPTLRARFGLQGFYAHSAFIKEAMKMKLDIHNYPLRLKREFEHLDKSPASAHNRALVKKFYDDCALQGLSKPRLIKLVEVTRCLAVLLKADFDKATIEQVKELVRQIDAKEWSPWTKVTYRAVLKKFYKWLKGNNEDYPPEVKWVKTTLKSKDVPLLSPQELITEDDIKKAINICDHPRNKAFLAILAESGCRIGEIGSLLVKNIAFDKHGIVLTVNGKTGPRRIRVISATPHIATWLNCHPFRDNPEAAVWINVGATNHREPMKYNALAKIIRDAFRAGGIKKRCNPHLFRHSRASLMANHLTEFQMNHYFGWTQGSDMPSTYVHLSGKDLDGAILKLNGLQTEETKPAQVQPRICPRCETINTTDSLYCSKCAAILNEKTAIISQKEFLEQQQTTQNANNLMNLLMQDKQVQEFLAQKVLALGLQKKVLSQQ
jgi:integrase